MSKELQEKELADIICRALLAIVAGLRRKYGLPDYHNVTVQVIDTPPPLDYGIIPETK